MKPIAFWKLAGPLLALFCLLAPARAEARGVMLITHGETAKDLGEIAPAMKQEIEEGTEPGAQMGYCYKYFGLFYLDLWTWAGRPCVHKGDTIWDLPEEVQASYAKVAPDQLKKPFFYSYPEGLCIVVALAAVAGILFAFGVISGAKEGDSSSTPDETPGGDDGGDGGDDEDDDEEKPQAANG